MTNSQKKTFKHGFTSNKNKANAMTVVGAAPQPHDVLYVHIFYSYYFLQLLSMFYIYIHIAFILALFRQFLFIFSVVFFSLLIRAFGWIHSFNLHRCMDAHSAKFVGLIVERFFLSGNRILFLACVNSALWLWSSPFLFHSCAVVGVFPCFFRFASQTNPLLATKEMIIC